MPDAAADHGEMKREIARLVGSDPTRYDDSIGTERHKRLTAAEVDAIADALGLGFLEEDKQTTRDAVMLKLGRDHRTGVRMWDSADLRAVCDALQEVPLDA